VEASRRARRSAKHRMQRYVLGRLAQAVPLLLLITLLVFGLTLPRRRLR
jgi:hypothetical protein